MFLEILYNVKKCCIKTWKKYFTIEGTYTSLLPDTIYLKKLYKHRMGKELNLKNPKTYSEKVNWLKLNDRKTKYSVLVDKYAVREYVKSIVGEDYLVPLLGVWDRIEDIDFSLLPNEFVLKCNHDNGVIICTNKASMDVEGVKKGLKFHLERDYYKKAREWPYKNVKRKIICEKFMKNTDGTTLLDYKVWCFNGEPKFIMLNSDRFSGHEIKVDMYDLEWNHMDMSDGPYPQAGDCFKKPDCLEEMLEVAKKLSKDIPFIRVDFNFWDGKLYFGELTFFHMAGLDCFRPEQWDETLGEWLVLPNRHMRGD